MPTPPKQSPAAGSHDRKRDAAEDDNAYQKPFDASRLRGARPLPGAHGGDDGYDSSLEEPAQNYFERSTRERDRKRLADRKERKSQRIAASEGWTHDAKNTSPGFYVRRDSLRFKQFVGDDKRGSCKTICTAYICLRHLGYSLQQTLRILQIPFVSELIHNKHRSTYRYEDKKFPGNPQLGIRTAPSIVSARLFDVMWRELISLSVLFQETLAAPSAAEMVKRREAMGYTSDIFFNQVIGCYASPNTKLPDSDEFFSTSHEKNDNIVENMPIRPPVIWTSTMQANLLGGYEACNARTLRHPERHDVRLHRTPMPFVVIDILRYKQFLSPGETPAAGHEVLVDFSDPDHPGIFDPNFGWMEPEQGFCTLSLEQALTTIWETYTQNRSTRLDRKGHRHFAPISDGVYMLAYQIYVQSAHKVILPPAPKSWFRSK